MGLDAATAKDRVAAMTDQEVQYLAGQIEQPARGRRRSWGVSSDPHHRRDLVGLEALDAARPQSR